MGTVTQHPQHQHQRPLSPAPSVWMDVAKWSPRLGLLLQVLRCHRRPLVLGMPHLLRLCTPRTKSACSCTTSTSNCRSGSSSSISCCSTSRSSTSTNNSNSSSSCSSSTSSGSYRCSRCMPATGCRCVAPFLEPRFHVCIPRLQAHFHASCVVIGLPLNAFCVANTTHSVVRSCAVATVYDCGWLRCMCLDRVPHGRPRPCIHSSNSSTRSPRLCTCPKPEDPKQDLLAHSTGGLAHSTGGLALARLPPPSSHLLQSWRAHQHQHQCQCHGDGHRSSQVPNSNSKPLP